jgi:hypothetical protein
MSVEQAEDTIVRGAIRPRGKLYTAKDLVAESVPRTVEIAVTLRQTKIHYDHFRQ